MKDLDFALIGQRIKELRVEQQLTQENLADMTKEKQEILLRITRVL